MNPQKPVPKRKTIIGCYIWAILGVQYHSQMRRRPSLHLMSWLGFFLANQAHPEGVNELTDSSGIIKT